jgi:hypothetical protein
MNRTAAEVLEDARRLPPGDFEWLMGQLLDSEDMHSEAEIDAAWKAEVELRVAQADASAETCSWEDVEAPLRARLAQ